jgi:hypothetical protein
MKHVLLCKGNLTFSTQTIMGPRVSGAQYGTALSSLGDINKDGYNGKLLIVVHFFLSDKLMVRFLEY